MTPETPRLSDTERTRWLRRLDKATAAHEKTRQQLDDLVADARSAGVSLTAISEHTPYSREWARQIASRVVATRAEGGATEGEARHADESTPGDETSP